MERCFWVNPNNPAYMRYHDEEWGVPCHSDRMLYELLLLECFQAGLSWECVLNKREAFRRAYDGFDVRSVARYGSTEIERLMANAAIIRNRRKIEASVQNSRVFLDIRKAFGTFDRYIWSFTEGKVVAEDCASHTSSDLSDQVSKDLKARGMRMVGSTTVYSYLQAVGVINGHTMQCFKSIAPEAAR